MSGSRPFLVLTLTHVSPLTWYHLLGHSLFREEHVIWAQILSINSLGAMTGLEMGDLQVGPIKKLKTCPLVGETEELHAGEGTKHASLGGRAIRALQWLEQFLQALSRVCSPSGTQMYSPGVNQCRVGFLLHIATIPKLTLHFWRRLIGRLWLRQTALRGQSALLRRWRFQWLQGNFLDINLISLPGKFALVTIMPKSSKILWNVPLRANMEGFKKSNRTALNDYHCQSFPSPVPFTSVSASRHFSTFSPPPFQSWRGIYYTKAYLTFIILYPHSPCLISHTLSSSVGYNNYYKMDIEVFSYFYEVTKLHKNFKWCT